MFTTAPLFGRFHSALKAAARPLVRQPLHHLECLLATRLKPAFLAPNPAGDNSRERLYTPKLTFLAFLDQVLQPDRACRAAVRQIRAHHQLASDPKRLTADTSAYCQARARWSLDELVEIRRHLATHLPREIRPWVTLRPVKVVDGSSLNLADTPANRQVYPQSTRQQPECGFPLVRLFGVFSLETGALLERNWAPFATSENALFQQLWPTFQAGDIILGDRLLGFWGGLAHFRAHQIDGVFRLMVSRNHDFRQGRPLGANDRLVTWAKSARLPANLTATEWAALPAKLEVRLVRFKVPIGNGRTRKVTLVTTLLDPVAWPVKALAALYARRWKIELFWKDLKTTLHLEALSCLTPDMAHKELEMHLIAYNLIRSLMGEVANTCHIPLVRLSFKGTLDTAGEYSRTFARIPARQRQHRLALYRDMIAAIAEDAVPERPHRFEPRCQKRRPKAYPFLTRPRRELRAAHVDQLPPRKNAKS